MVSGYANHDGMHPSPHNEHGINVGAGHEDFSIRVICIRKDPSHKRPLTEIVMYVSHFIPKYGRGRTAAQVRASPTR